MRMAIYGAVLAAGLLAAGGVLAQGTSEGGMPEGDAPRQDAPPQDAPQQDAPQDNQPGGGTPVIDATNPDAVLGVVRDLGYRATLTTDSSDDPMIEAKIAGVPVTIFFYSCRDNKDCGQIQFRAAFDTGGKGSPASMAEWNSEKLFGVATLDSDFDPAIKMTVNMVGGVSRKNLEDTVDWFDVVLAEFKQHIDF